MFKKGRPPGAVPSRLLELNAPFCLGETRHHFNQCDLFRSFHVIVEVQFGGLARLDRAINNCKDNLNSLYKHPDMMLTVDRALQNVCKVIRIGKRVQPDISKARQQVNIDRPAYNKTDKQCRTRTTITARLPDD